MYVSKKIMFGLSATTLNLAVTLVQCATRIQACNYLYQTNGHDRQPIYQNREQLLSRSKQNGVSISTNVFEVYMLQVKVSKSNYNSYIVIYIT